MSAVDAIVAKLDDARQSGNSWSAKCPAHEDRKPSLNITERSVGDPGALIHCFAGCTPEDVTTALGMTRADLFDDKPARPQKHITDTYNYTDENGATLYRVARFDPKDFRPQTTGDNGKTWQNGYNGQRRVIYHLPAVIAAVTAGEPVYIVEGEKDADALVAAGVCATTAAGGAQSWRHVADQARDVLTDANVIVIPDKDKPGRRFAVDVIGSLKGHAGSITVAHAAIGKDAADHLGAGKTLTQFVLAASDTLRRDGSVSIDQWLDDRGGDDQLSDDPLCDGSRALAESFRRVDLAAVLSGDLTQPIPTVLYSYGDGIRRALIYESVVNGIHGDSGIGKSWIAVAAMKEMVQAGENVMLLDLEDTPESIVSRLKLVGVTDDQIVDHLDYRRPAEPFGPVEMTTLLETIAHDNVKLVVIDSLGEAFGSEGINEDRDNEVGPWLRSTARPLADAGPAVLLIDHSTKSKEGKQLHPSGSKRKRAAIGGASYLVEAVTPFVKGGDGRLRIICGKDRHGTYGQGEHVAWLDLHTALDGTVTLEVIAAAPAVDVDHNELLERKILEVLATEGTMSKKALGAALRNAGHKASNAAISDAVALMIHHQTVQESPGPRNASMLSIRNEMAA